MTYEEQLDYASYLVGQENLAVADAHNVLAHLQRIEDPFKSICAAVGSPAGALATEFQSVLDAQRQALASANERLQKAKSEHQRLLAKAKL
ncbi:MULTISPECIES: hypothetical protein [unclassified Pseudoxanthomonas]|uniref:hypothetical protein n=1 Tax=unclassified Pseudoxanthomonas TaxID=2645906 RepID=UPI0030774FAF